jgi:hypothetical protein
MDLIITVDTAVAHVTGAKNKLAWILLPYTCDWRWLVTGDRSSWYPSMRLFRQRELKNWKDVALRVADELHDLAQKTV